MSYLGSVYSSIIDHLESGSTEPYKANSEEWQALVADTRFDKSYTPLELEVAGVKVVPA